MSSPEMDELTQAIIANADQHVASARDIFGLHMDFSEASMAQTDEAITKFHPDGCIMDTTILGYGSYVGEVIRRNLGGRWVQDERGVALLEQIGGIDLKAFPFSWTRKRFDNGIEDSLAYKYSFIKHEVAKSGGQVSPEPVAMPAPETDPLAGPAVNQLARAPLLVFIMVAAADGKVDKKEMGAFREILQTSDRGDSRLLRTLIREVTIPNLQTFLAELTVENFSPVDELKSVAAVLDEHYPDQAEVFKESLVDIARRIAEASGGVFGFGKKIDKDEETVIMGIALMLGLFGEDSAGSSTGAEASDLELLGQAPIIVLMVVAAADGSVDRKEIQAFKKVLETTENCPSALLKEALETVTLPNLMEIFDSLAGSELDPLEELERTAAMLDERHPQEALLCKQLLVAIARKIAEASGGFLGFGKKIDKDEEEAINAIAAALGLETGDE